jgi:hypothetical protein
MSAIFVIGLLMFFAVDRLTKFHEASYCLLVISEFLLTHRDKQTVQRIGGKPCLLPIHTCRPS